jgi:Ca2+/H+ antiporter, TMEM165/GDT1 family
MSRLAIEAAWPTMAAAFLASLVEWLESVSILVLAPAKHRRRQVLLGSCLSLILFFALTGALTATVWCISPDLVQLVLGTLLLLFGLRLLREAVLRAAGVSDANEGEAGWARAMSRLRWHARNGAASTDRIALASVITLLMPKVAAVSFLITEIGAAGGAVLPPAAGASGALFIAIPVGLAVQRWPAPRLRRGLELLSGAWLAGLGTFWSGKGIGASWLGDEAAVMPLVAGFIGMGLILIPLARSRVSGMI